MVFFVPLQASDSNGTEQKHKFNRRFEKGGPMNDAVGFALNGKFLDDMSK